MKRSLQLALRVERLELAILGACVLTLLAFTAYVLVSLAGLAPLSQCGDPSCAAYGLRNDQIQNGHLVMLGYVVVSLTAAALLGSQLVAREIERGTAPIVWSLARSRVRWFTVRATVALALLAFLVVPLAIAGHFLEGGIEDSVSPNASLIDVAMRGPGLASVAVGTFGAALLFGAVLGRMLPALLLSVIVGVAALAAVALLPAVVGQPEVIGPYPSKEIAHSIVFEERFRTASGDLLSLEQAMALAPEGSDPQDWAWNNLDRVAYGVPGSEYPAVALATAMIVGGIAIVCAGMTVLVVSRRRPE